VDVLTDGLMLHRYMRLASSAPTFEVRDHPSLGEISLVLDVVARVFGDLS
jgi:hypothetical protein